MSPEGEQILPYGHDAVRSFSRLFSNIMHYDAY